MSISPTFATADFGATAPTPHRTPESFAVFVEKRPQIYALYNDEIGKLINPGTVKETLRYFDEFYETINDPRSARRSIIEPIARP